MTQGRKCPRAELHWEGDSLDVLRSWPVPVRKDFGLSLGEMQDGRRPRLDNRPMKSVGAGVFELKDSDNSAWYRLMYLKRIGNVIHILHCFTKKTKKTEKMDLETAKARFSQIKNRNVAEERNEKGRRKKQSV